MVRPTSRTAAVLLTAILAAAAAPAATQGKEKDKDVMRDVRRHAIVLPSGGDSGRAYLGVQVIEEVEGTEGGARVETVVADSPAAEAGLREGDVIVGLGGEIVRGPRGLTTRLKTHAPGDRVDLSVLRDGRRQSLEVVLGESPAPRVFALREGDLPDEWFNAEKQKELQEKLREMGERLKGNVWMVGPRRPRLGVELVEVTPELREHLGAESDRGVLVGRVLSGTPAERAGLEVGDLIVSADGEPVRDPSDLIRALADKSDAPIKLEVVRDGRRLTLEPFIPKEEIPSGPQAALAPPAPPAAPALPVRVEIFRAAPAAPLAPVAPVAPLAPVAPVPVPDGPYTVL